MAKINTFIKPALNLPVLPAINMYLLFQYSEVKTHSQYIAFINNCFTVAETSLNSVKAQIYFNVASSLYALETNISYESKAVELLFNSL
jgi:hypothetical protein